MLDKLNEPLENTLKTVHDSILDIFECLLRIKADQVERSCVFLGGCEAKFKNLAVS